MDRRTFLKAGAAAGVVLAVSGTQSFGLATDSRVDVLVNEPLGTIAPEVYGHFTEHLGAVIYDGIWVGEGSKIPNTGGIRTALIERMRQISAPMIRWPGGCFADSYDWADGTGPRAKRPARAGFWGDEPNSFGTTEFVRFCRLCNAEPYLAANVRSLPALAFDHWIEYCNAPADKSALARQRAQDGSPEPFNVRYWGIGNESWGCGGNFRPEEYGEEFRRFTSWLPKYGDKPLQLIGSGPSADDLDWTRRFFESTFSSKRALSPKVMAGWSVHYYTWDLARGRTHDWDAAKGDALKFDVVDWYELLRQGDQLESYLKQQWEIMAEHDPEHHIRLVVDEYGSWYRPGTELELSHTLGQQVTLRDALLTALTLDTFNRHPDKISIGACAQLVNCLNCLFFAHEDKFVVTPNFYVFEMYKAHQGGKAVRAEFSAPRVRYTRDGAPADFWGLQGSASLNGRTLTLTAVNPDTSSPREAIISVRGSRIASGKATILSNAEIHAHNSFEHPDVVQTRVMEVRQSGADAQFTFPPASVTQLTLQLS
jgi:alpha-L-arabinofuranosidase